MGKEYDSICNTCKEADHFFYDYVKMNQLWTVARHVISHNLSKNSKLTIEDVMQLITKTPICNLSDLNFMNHVIAVGKLCINKFRYGDQVNERCL